MASGCWKPQLPRTELAEKYGHLLMPIIKDAIPLKSGLTPITLNPHATDSETKFAEDVRYIQRRLYSNFTAAELERIEAVAPLYNTYEDETLVNASANIAIHPVMQRKKWNYPLPKQAAEFPLGKDLDGYWNAYTNDIVWEALLPALRIASLYFSNIDMWPWHDALFASEWTEILQKEIPILHFFGRRGYRRFFTRDPFVYGSEAARRNVRNKLLNFSKNIYFSLTSCFVDSTSGVKIFDASRGSIAGSTIASSIDNICVINLDFRSISALLPGTVEKLNVAERRLIHCDFAITIIHELAHAIYQQECKVSHPDYGGMLREIYFEQEVTSELGISLEQTLFGGITAGIRGPSGEGKIAHLEGGGMAYDINTRYLQGYNGDHPVLLNKPPTFNKCTFWPVPVSWFLNMGSKSKFELFVRKYGLHNARYTRIVGSEFEVDSDGDAAQVSRHPFVEFEGIPDKNRHAESSMDRLESQRPQKRRRVEHAIVREAVCRQPQRSLEEELGVDNEETVDSKDEDQDLPPCPRFHEISRYLIDNRRQLALHTMCFAMPEHTLRDYIRRLGGLKISAQEWRTYLLHCNSIPYLFRFESEEEPGDFSTYRGSIQLHASSWPRTDLTPLRPKREKFERAEGNALAFILAVHRLNEAQIGGRDIMWPQSTFWDFSAERFLALFNADVKNGNGEMSKLGLGLMSKEELEDMLWHVASTSPFLTWAPEGIIRRLPLTTPEFMEIRGGDATWDEVVLPKGRRLIDWDEGSKALLGWDNTKMETDPEVLEEDTGITYTDGRVCSSFEYQEKLSIKEKENAPPGPPPTEEQLEYMAAEKKIQDLIRSVEAYIRKFPDAKQQEVFDNSFWPIWTVNNPGKSVEEGFAEYKDCYSTPGDVVPSEDLMEMLAKNEKCNPQ
ncbi:8010588e-ef91-4fb5-adf5-f8a3efb3b9b0 [Sclerotinia trifoliorum]|uniref:8010588e-ef91-4fb5-adf5-f8a3efb3b9b0 n=1 Tax=Sclerotinia trifoliorum TaxID=28548 RepID=A0A8H2VP31_9HELO|nr:8010588e-ef91-4fb5-adf5-f8a3efb3b9b0 [Sclerotinia trifoliorum]